MAQVAGLEVAERISGPSLNAPKPLFVLDPGSDGQSYEGAAGSSTCSAPSPRVPPWSQGPEPTAQPALHQAWVRTQVAAVSKVPSDSDGCRGGEPPACWVMPQRKVGLGRMGVSVQRWGVCLSHTGQPSRVREGQLSQDFRDGGSAGRLKGIQGPHLLSCLEAHLVWDQRDPGHTTLPTPSPRAFCYYTSEIR